MHFELSSLIVWITHWIVNTYSESQVSTFSNNRDNAKCQSFCTTTMTTTRKQYLEFSPQTADLINVIKKLNCFFQHVKNMGGGGGGGVV